MLKKIMLSLVLSLFVAVSVFPTISNAVETHKFRMPYISVKNFDSEINPHLVLFHWDIIDAVVINNDKNLIIAMGNPRIDWSNWTPAVSPDSIPVPAGEITGAVYFFFVMTKMKDGQKMAVLVSYGYQHNGIKYSYRMNAKTKTYVLFRTQGQKNS